FTTVTNMSEPRVLVIDGTNTATQARQGPNDFRLNFGLAGSATTITAGAGLTGGGNLSANRTLAIDIATPAQAQAGSNNTTVITPLRMAQGTIGSSVQSWSNVIGSRSSGTVYQNSTGCPIMVSISGANATSQVSVNGTSGWVTVGAPVSDSRQMQSFIVPNGHYYRSTSSSFENWAELR